MKLYRVDEGVIVEDEGGTYLCEDAWDELLNRDDLFRYLKSLLEESELPTVGDGFVERALPPIVSQEVWAAGVTYYRSRTARIE